MRELGQQMDRQHGKMYHGQCRRGARSRAPSSSAFGGHISDTANSLGVRSSPICVPKPISRRRYERANHRAGNQRDDAIGRLHRSIDGLRTLIGDSDSRSQLKADVKAGERPRHIAMNGRLRRRVRVERFDSFKKNRVADDAPLA